MCHDLTYHVTPMTQCNKQLHIVLMLNTPYSGRCSPVCFNVHVAVSSDIFKYMYMWVDVYCMYQWVIYVQQAMEEDLRGVHMSSKVYHS